MLIYLIGYMATGKSTLGKKIANKVGFRFLDLDKLVEKEQGKTISQLFVEKGEKYFRQKEKQELEKTFSMKNTVIATGGGTPCFFNNMQNINKYGESIFIQMPVNAIVNRLKKAKIERPLIANLDSNELYEFIDKQIKERMSFYSQAKHTINGLDKDWEHINCLFSSTNL